LSVGAGPGASEGEDDVDGVDAAGAIVWWWPGNEPPWANRSGATANVAISGAL
jgi:hypothetical protein